MVAEVDWAAGPRTLPTERLRAIYAAADRRRGAAGWRGREDVDDAADRLGRQLAARTARWHARLPARFATAALADVTDEQDPGRQARRWLTRPESRTLLLAGEPDRGKTHLAYAVGAAALTAGRWVEAWTAADMLATLRPGGDDTLLDRLAAVDLLILDDLGREQVTSWSLEQLQRLLDARSRECRRQLVTTNLTYAQVTERYGSPIAGRLVDTATVVRVEGPCRRTPDPW